MQTPFLCPHPHPYGLLAPRCLQAKHAAEDAKRALEDNASVAEAKGQEGRGKGKRTLKRAEEKVRARCLQPSVGSVRCALCAPPACLAVLLLPRTDAHAQIEDAVNAVEASAAKTSEGVLDGIEGAATAVRRKLHAMHVVHALAALCSLKFAFF
jgi:hypothetical protein